MKKGIDVSQHQGIIDWSTVKNNVDFAIIRIGWGEVKNASGGDIDANAIENIKNAIAANVPIGIYLYSYAKTKEEAIMEAKFALSQIMQFPKEIIVYGVWIDVEDEEWQGNIDINPIIDGFCEHVSSQGYQTGFYCNLNWLTNRVSQEIKNKWINWLAQYNTTPDVASPIWQYSSTGSVPGINGNVDMNIAYIEFPCTVSQGTITITDPVIEPPTIEKEQPTASTNLVQVDVEYQSHVENDSWHQWNKNGEMNGTTGEAKRLEAIVIKLKTLAALQLKYQTHVQDKGWMDVKSDGEISGTTGEAKRLEAIKIWLEGTDSDKYSIWYRCYIENDGYLDWCRDGEPSGSEGLALRAEAIQILVLPKTVNLKVDGVDGFKKNINPTVTTTPVIVNPPTAENPVPVVVESPNDASMASANFSWYEYACDCIKGYDDIPNKCNGYPSTSYGQIICQDLIDKIQRLRDRVASPITVNSGIRCQSCNSYWGGASDSLHMQGEAADLYCPGLTPQELADIAHDEIGLGVIIYSNFVHVQTYERYSYGGY